jgi:hypothetical protein
MFAPNDAAVSALVLPEGMVGGGRYPLLQSMGLTSPGLSTATTTQPPPLPMGAFRHPMQPARRASSGSLLAPVDRCRPHG